MSFVTRYVLLGRGSATCVNNNISKTELVIKRNNISMKRLLLLLVALVMIVPMAEAKRRETPEEIERKTRHYSGWEWGAQGRFALTFYELNYQKVYNEAPVKSYFAGVKHLDSGKAMLGGNVMINGGYFIDNNWKVGLEIGGQFQYNHIVVPISAKVHYFYGKRKNCLFNFLGVGTNMLFDKGARFGVNGEGGVGYRMQSPNSKLKYEIVLGYQAIMFNPRPYGGGYQFRPGDVKFKRLNQSVFIGLGVYF